MRTPGIPHARDPYQSCPGEWVENSCSELETPLGTFSGNMGGDGSNGPLQCQVIEPLKSPACEQSLTNETNLCINVKGLLNVFHFNVLKLKHKIEQLM